MIPTAPEEAIDLMSKLFTYDPSQRLSALEVLQHPFLSELYSPGQDSGLVEGTPIDYYDYEFEQYSINQEILRELILDEIIINNCKKAKVLNKELKERYPGGVLELIYDRKQKEEQMNIVMPETKPRESALNVALMAENIQEQIDKAEESRIAHESKQNFKVNEKSAVGNVKKLSSKVVGIVEDRKNKIKPQDPNYLCVGI